MQRHIKAKNAENENELTREEINELNDNEYEKFTKNELFSIDICSLILTTLCAVLKVYGIFLLLVCLRYFVIKMIQVVNIS